MYKIIKTINIKTSNYFYGIIKSKDLTFDNQIGNSVNITDPMTYQFSKTKFQQAVKEFGVKNFRTEVQDYGDSFEEMYLKLQDYLTPEKVAQIECYNNIYPIQNLTYYVYDKNGYYLGEMHNYDADIILNGLKVKDLYICPNKDKNFAHAKKMFIQERPVFKYDINGNLMKRYDTQVEAEQDNKYSNITKSIKLKQACRNGYFWSMQELPKLNWKNRKWVQQYDKDGNYIRGWKFKKQCYRDIDYSIFKSFNTNEPYHDGFLYFYN